MFNQDWGLAARIPIVTRYVNAVENGEEISQKNTAIGDIRFADVSFPIYQRVNGQQLVAKETFKMIFSKDF